MSRQDLTTITAVALCSVACALVLTAGVSLLGTGSTRAPPRSGSRRPGTSGAPRQRPSRALARQQCPPRFSLRRPLEVKG